VSDLFRLVCDVELYERGLRGALQLIALR